MKKISLYISLLILFQSCQDTQSQSTKTDNTTVEEFVIETPEEIEEPMSIDFDIETHLVNYKKLKSSITQQKRAIKSRTELDQEAKYTLAENYMSKTLIDSIFPYWLGTEWDFNGYTETPRKGVVACGYFVSTTLRDLGIKLNRYKIAQKGATDIILALCNAETVVKLSSVDKVSEFMKDVNDNEILIVGLDYHVGFLFRKNNQNYFAHSNYIGMRGVEIERMEDSQNFANSNLYVIGNLTKNREMTKNWLNN